MLANYALNQLSEHHNKNFDLMHCIAKSMHCIAMFLSLETNCTDNASKLRLIQLQ